jgi:hypothetical protein
MPSNARPWLPAFAGNRGDVPSSESKLALKAAARDRRQAAGTIDGQRQLTDIINPDDSLRAASSPSRLSRPDPKLPDDVSD